MATRQFLTTAARRCAAVPTGRATITPVRGVLGGGGGGGRPSLCGTQHQQQQAKQLSTLSSSSRRVGSARYVTATTLGRSVFSARRGGAVRFESTSSSSAGETKIWSFEQIRDLTSKPYTTPIIIDVREPHELQNTGHIPGAINVPIKSAPESFLLPEEDFEAHYGFARPAKDAEVVFYCKAGVRSRAAAGIAKGAGWEKVGEYPGSWDEWFGKGGEVQR